MRTSRLWQRGCLLTTSKIYKIRKLASIANLYKFAYSAGGTDLCLPQMLVRLQADKNAASESLPSRRFSVVDQSEHFTAKPPLKK